VLTCPLSLAANVGRSILEAGGETYRAEEAVVILCNAWGYKESECFATPTGLMSSAIDKDGRSVSAIRRIQRRSVDLNRIARIQEEITKEADLQAGLELFKTCFESLLIERSYPVYFQIIAAGICAAFFTLLFGGTFLDAIPAFIAGLIVKIFSIATLKKYFPDFIINMAGGALVAIIAVLFKEAYSGFNLDKIIIGSIMLLVPGLATVNAVRDTIAGDLVAGVARLADAFIAAAAISMGSGFVLSVAVLIEGLLA
jgi:uncharacterized membrane protein YjjP (DUF1212 family)